MNQLMVGSLFSGVGCIDLALQDVGMAIAWQCEIDPICRRVLGRHWPTVTRYEDAREIDPRQIEPVNLVAAGFPCQDISVAGLRAGLAGERSGLFFEFIRVVAVVRPRWILLENVDGLLSSFSPVEPPPSDLQEGDEWETEETSDLGVILSTLGDLGYGWAYRVFDAQYFGVAQRRNRVFIVGCLGDWASAAKVLFEPESCAGDSPPSRQAREGVASATTNGAGSAGNTNGRRREDGMNLFCIKGSAIGRRPEAGPQYGEILEDGSCYTLNCTEVHAVAHALTANYGKQPDNSNRNGGPPNLILQDVVHALTSEGADASEDGTGRGVPTIVFDWQSGGDVRLHANSTRTSPLSVRQTPAVRYGVGVRRLMPIECERLFGLPDNWTAYDAQGKPISDSARYRMLGNGVVRANAAWIARRIVAVDQEVCRDA